MKANPKVNPLILVIEDEEALCELIKDELSELGYRILIATNGVEGLDMIQDYEPDLVICDRAMPAMTGSELLERLRAVYPQYTSVPFIFLTALTSARDKAGVTELKPFAYLEKPLNFDLLQRTIKQALGQKSA